MRREKENREKIDIPMKSQIAYGTIAYAAWKTFIANHGLDSYASILALHGLGRLGKIMASQAILDEAKTWVAKYLAGEVPRVGGAYGEMVYRTGGNAAAWMLTRNYLPEAQEKLIAAAERLCRDFSRNEEGLFCISRQSSNLVWIDTVFGVCPFLLWVGQAAGRREFIDESVFQMLGHQRLLFNPEKRLYHQAHWQGKRSAFWGRGVGWAILALAELAYDLPKDHRERETVLGCYREIIDGCLAVQDKDGIFHQCLDDPGSYAESSATGLILYGIGRGIKNGTLDRNKVTEPFLRGIRGLSRYIALDGSVFNCCVGCLWPGQGTTASYAEHQWKLNDIHAAGPVICAFSQAEQLHRHALIPTFTELIQG